MKKVLFLFMLILFLAGCGSDKQSKAEIPENSGDEAEQLKEELEISSLEIRDMFGRILVTGTIENAPEDLEVTVKVTGIENDYTATDEQGINKFGVFITDQFSQSGDPLESGEYNIEINVKDYDVSHQETFVVDFEPKVSDDDKSEDAEEEAAEDESEETTETEIEAEDIVETISRDQMIQDIVDLIDEGLAFDTGSYIKGDIPKGEYAFVTFDGSGQYYAEKEISGSIIDNENFDSFGYVYVHEEGNVETKGALVKVEALGDLGVSGAKELYEILNELEDYKGSGWYKAGLDIEPGEYIIESIGDGYVAVMNGPVGNTNIDNNENFNGKFAVNVKDGQYLKISRGTIAE